MAVVLDVREIVESSGDTIVQKSVGIDRESLRSGAPLTDLVQVLELRRPKEVAVQAQSRNEAHRLLEMLDNDLDRQIEDSVKRVVTAPRCYTAIAAANADPRPYRRGVALHVGEYTGPEKKLFGGEFRYFYTPRLVLDKSGGSVHGEIQGGDVANVAGTDFNGKKVVLVSAFDGVTNWNQAGRSDFKASRNWEEVLSEASADEPLSHLGMKELILVLNQRFIERAGIGENLLGTLALARVTKTESNGQKIELACVGDTKATVVWIDDNNVLHTETVSSFINTEIDKVTVAATRAAQMTNGNRHFLELAEIFRRTTYMDKFAAGEGTVGVIGKTTLSKENIATHEVMVPANTRFFKVVTYTDGVELYAKLLDIPPWLCALLFERHIPSVNPNSTVSYGTAPDKGQLFPGAAPFGIAAIHAIYALLHPDAYPFEAELRNKWDDAAGASFGNDLKFLFEYIRQKVHTSQPQVSVKSYTNKVGDLVRWYLELLEDGINKAEHTGLVYRRGHRHR